MIEVIKALIEAIKVVLGAILCGIFFIITSFIEETHETIKRK